ncbi:MAG: hypothetical protein QOJ99_5774, partial [Bryobacterales bacterium]|nr:hypothetical protein [Bryobacterales bacterium]
MRRLGIQIDTASINGPDRPDMQLTEDERSEAHRTFYVKRAGAAGALSAGLATLFSNPAGYF